METGWPRCQRCNSNLVPPQARVCAPCASANASDHWRPLFPEYYYQYSLPPAPPPTFPSPTIPHGYESSGFVSIFDPVSNAYYWHYTFPQYGAQPPPFTNIYSPSPEPDFRPPLPEDFHEEAESGSAYSTSSGTSFESTISCNATEDTVDSRGRPPTVRPRVEDNLVVERGRPVVSCGSPLRLVWRKFWTIFAIIAGAVRSRWLSSTVAKKLATSFLNILNQVRVADAVYLLLLIVFHRRAPRVTRRGE